MPSYTTGTHAPNWDDSGLPKSVREYLANGAKDHRNDRLSDATQQCHDAGFTKEEVAPLLRARALADGLGEKEIEKTIDSAFKRLRREPAKTKSATSPTAAAATASPGSGASTRKQNAPRSQPSAAAIPLPNPLPNGYRLLLETAFTEKERVAIGKGSRLPDWTLAIDYGDVKLRKIWLRENPLQCPEGTFIRINPMAYRGAKNSDVTAYRHTLVEFDCDANGARVSKEIQYAALVRSGFPITAIIDSGDRGLHAWPRVEAVDKAQYDERVAIVYEHFRQYSFFDDKNKAPNKWSRLPGATRILYDAANNPIGIGRQELLVVNVGPVSWDVWESSRNGPAGAAAVTEEELQAHDAEITKQLLGEDQAFPEPMDEEAFYGIAGRIVKIIEADNEPCRESLLGHLLVGFGNMLGWNAWMHQGDVQRTNEFGLFVGPSSIGRKGTAWSLVRRLLMEVDQQWTAKRVRRALQSGEAIIHEIRDPNTKGTGKHQQFDPGVSDKRLVIMESEVTRFLTVGKRRGNNLFDVTHDCWDSLDPLCCTSKTAGESATHPHVSMIAHSTTEAYLKALPEEEKTNGSVNRSLILVVYRAKKRSRPPTIFWRSQHWAIVEELRKILTTFSIQREMSWSPESVRVWDAFYHNFETKTKGGMISSILDRLPTHVVRIAMIYCALDNSCLVSVDHLKAALAFCQYARRSAEWLFGVKTGNHDADRLYAHLVRIKPKGHNRTEIADYVYNKNRSSAQLDELFSLLLKAELICVKSEPNPRKGPRYIEKWYAV